MDSPTATEPGHGAEIPMAHDTRRRRRRGWAGLLAVLALAIGATPSHAQQVTDLTPGETLYEFRLVDGSLVIARVTEVDGDRLVLTTEAGARLEVEASQISGFSQASGRVVNGEYWNEDPNQTRLFFMNTGRALRQGQAYIGTYAIVFPFVSVGITDHLSVAAGAPILLGELEPFYVAPKLKLVGVEGFDLSVGALTLIYDGDTFGVAFASATIGDSDRAAHAALGWGFSGDDFASEPVAMVGGEVRFSRRGKFITENYFLPGETSVALTGGVRFIGERLAADLGVGGLVGNDDTGCCIPLVSFSYSFGRR